MNLAHRLQFAALNGLIGILRHVSWDRACRAAERVGAWGYRPLGVRRHVVERQIAAAFPELDEQGVRRLSRESYRHLGRMTVETALLSSLGPDRVIGLFEEGDGLAELRGALAEGKGVAIVAGHHGNWELAAGFMAASGIPLEVIVRKMNNPLFDRLVNDTRERLGMRVIADSEAVRRAPRALREGRAVGFVADQGVKGLASTFVPFFGRPAKTPRGAAVFALRFGAPVVLVGALRLPSGRFQFFAERVPAPASGDREADTDELVRRYTAALERRVRAYPEQYFWHHRRWRRQPPDTPDALRDPAANPR